jgi:hypothetical protein
MSMAMPVIGWGINKMMGNGPKEEETPPLGSPSLDYKRQKNLNY